MCLKSQLYHILVDNDNEEEPDLFLDCPNSLEDLENVPTEEDTPVLSLHAWSYWLSYNASSRLG